MLTQSAHTAQTARTYFPQLSVEPRLSESAETLSSHAAGCEIFAQGEPVRKMYRLENGVVRICRFLQDGRRHISAFHFPGDVFGLEAEDCHSVSAEAITPVRVAGFRTTNVVPMRGRDDQVTGDMWRVALRSLTQSQEHLLLLGRRNALERVASFIVEMAERQDSARLVELAMPRVDIADYLGLTLETISRMLTQLKDMGLIRLRSSRRIELLDLEALEDMIY